MCGVPATLFCRNGGGAEEKASQQMRLCRVRRATVGWGAELGMLREDEPKITVRTLGAVRVCSFL